MAAQEEESPEPINNCRKWVLKVSIHCEACKKKVKKILSQVQGVYETNIDTKQQKVIVIGTVDADTLIKKLAKSGKHAELLPAKADEKEKKPRNKEKPAEQPVANEETSQAVVNNDKEVKPKAPPVKAEIVQEPPQKNQNGGVVAAGGAGNGGGVKTAATGSGGAADAAKVTEGNSKACSADQVAKESKSEEKKPEAGLADQPVAAEGKGGGSDTCNSTGSGKVGGRDGGNSGKKKKKKVQNGNNGGGEQSSVAAADVKSQNHNHPGPQTDSVPSNENPPRHPSYYHYQPQYYGPPPEYAVSYNTAYPTSNHTASYYAPPPPNAYVHAYSGPETQPPRSDFESYPRQPLDSFEMFSDENPNGCSIM